LDTRYDKNLFCGALPVILFGFITGLIVWYIIFEYPPHRYTLDFKGATWITTGKQTPNGYFVKEIIIPHDTADAWINIAATDRVDLFVNGTLIASDSFVSLNVSAIHDITGTLQRGKNIIAASVRRGSYPGSPKLLLKGVYKDLVGEQHVFYSDHSWKISALEEVQGFGNIMWYSQHFDHSGWPHAVREGASSKFPIYASSYAPFLLGKALSGQWIWHPGAHAKSVYFQKTFKIDSRVRDGFIGIAGTLAYDLTVNGAPVASRSISRSNLDIYDITPLLHTGMNIIGIDTQTLETTPGLYVEGYIQDNHSIINLKSDTTWMATDKRTNETFSRDAGSREWETITVLAHYPSPPWGVLKKSVQNIDVPNIYRVKEIIKFISFLFVVILVLLGFWYATASFFARVGNVSLGDALLSDGVLHLPAFLFLVFLYLIKFDVRYDPTFPFQTRFILTAFGILLLFRLAHFISLSIKTGGLKQ